MCAVILVLLIGWVYVHSKAMPDNGGNPNRLLVDVRYWTVCYFIIFWGGAFVVILSVMAATNFELIHQEIEFLLHRLTVREEAPDVVKKGQEEIKEDDGEDSQMSTEGVSDAESEKSDGVEWYQAIFGGVDITDRVGGFSSVELPNSTVRPRLSSIRPAASFEEDESLDSPKRGRSHMTLKDRVMSGLETTTDEAKYEELDDLLDTVVLIVEAQSRIDPRRFLGAEISWNIVISFVAAWGTMIGLSLTVAGLDYSLG